MLQKFKIFLASVSLMALTGCNLGFVSFGDKGNLFKGAPAPASPLDQIPTKFVMEINGQPTAVVPFALGFCSSAIKVRALSKSDAVAKVRVRTDVLISGITPTKLFADANCTTALPLKGGIPSVPLEAGESEGVFYMKDVTPTTNTTQSFLALANASGYPEASRALRVDRTLVGLAVGDSSYNTAAAAIGGGICQEMTLWGVDGVGQRFFPSSGAVEVTLSSTGAGTFYGSAACAGTDNTVTLNSSAGAKFWYKNNQVNASTVVSTANAVNLANATRSIGTTSVPIRLRFRTPLPTTNVAGLCQSYTVDFLDSAGGASSFGVANAGITITTRLQSAAVAGDVYNVSTCTGSPVTTVTPSGTATSVQFWFKAGSGIAHGNSVYFEASRSGLTGDSTSSVPLAVSTEVREVTITGTMSNPRIGICNGTTPLTVSVFDGRAGSAFTRGTSVTLSRSAGGAGAARFYSDKFCETEYAGGVVPIAAGGNTATFYYKDGSPSTATVTLRARGPAMTGGGDPEGTKDLTLTVPLLEDGSFGSGGYATAGFSSGSVRAFAAGASGRYLFAGTNADSLVTARASTTGSRDYLTSVRPAEHLRSGGNAVVADSSESIVAGWGFNEGDGTPAVPDVTEYLIARIGGSGGIQATGRGQFSASASESVINSVARLTGGRYAAAGFINEGTRAPAVAVFGSGLNLDGSFGTGGVIVLGGAGQAKSVVAIDSSAFMVFSEVGGNVTFTKFEHDETAAICGDTINNVTFSAATLAAGKIYAALKNSGNELVLTRINFSNCSVDTSFAASGFAGDSSTTNDVTTGIAVYSDAAGDPDSFKILLAGTRNSAGNKSFLVSRYTRNGAADSASYTGAQDFGSGNDDEAYGVILLGQGKIMLGGASGSSFGLAQFLR